MKIAVIRIRGIRNINPRTKRTMELLMINKPNHCVIVDDSVQTKGMLQRAKDYICYGEIKEETLVAMITKRGTSGSKRVRDISEKKEIEEMAKKIFDGDSVRKYINPVFRLRPRKGGYKNIKKSYPEGELGKRPDMDLVIRKMI